MKLNLTIFSFGFMGSAFGARPTTFGFTRSAFGLDKSSHLFLIRTAGTARTAETTGTGITTHGNMSFGTIGTSLASTFTS